MPLGPLQSLKQLETLVKEASASLQRVTADNRGLRERLTRLEGEHKRLKDELKEARLVLARHERLKTRLGRLAEKLERI